MLRQKTILPVTLAFILGIGALFFGLRGYFEIEDFRSSLLGSGTGANLMLASYQNSLYNGDFTISDVQAKSWGIFPETAWNIKTDEYGQNYLSVEGEIPVILKQEIEVPAATGSGQLLTLQTHMQPLLVTKDGSSNGSVEFSLDAINENGTIAIPGQDTYFQKKVITAASNSDVYWSGYKDILPEVYVPAEVTKLRLTVTIKPESYHFRIYKIYFGAPLPIIENDILTNGGFEVDSGKNYPSNFGDVTASNGIPDSWKRCTEFPVALENSAVGTVRAESQYVTLSGVPDVVKKPCLYQYNNHVPKKGERFIATALIATDAEDADAHFSLRHLPFSSNQNEASMNAHTITSHWNRITTPVLEVASEESTASNENFGVYLSLKSLTGSGRLMVDNVQIINCGLMTTYPGCEELTKVEETPVQTLLLENDQVEKTQQSSDAADTTSSTESNEGADNTGSIDITETTSTSSTEVDVTDIAEEHTIETTEIVTTTTEGDTATTDASEGDASSDEAKKTEVDVEEKTLTVDSVDKRETNTDGEIKTINASNDIGAAEENLKSSAERQVCPPLCPSIRPMKDVTSSHFAFNAVRYLASRNIMEGNSAGQFLLEASVNRAEFAKLITRGFLLDSPDASKKVPFTDVHENLWYYPFVRVMQQRGIVEGYNNGTVFRGTNLIQRAEAAKMLTLASGVTETALEEAFATWRAQHPTWTYVQFSDVPVDAWYAKYVLYMHQQGFITGREVDSTRLFFPASRLTRGEAAVLLARMIYTKQIEFPVVQIGNFFQVRFPE